MGPHPDTQPPTVALTEPSPSAELDGSVQLPATATEDVGVIKVEFWLDGTTKLGEATGQPWTFSGEVSNVS